MSYFNLDLLNGHESIVMLINGSMIKGIKNQWIEDQSSQGQFINQRIKDQNIPESIKR